MVLLAELPIVFQKSADMPKVLCIFLLLFLSSCKLSSPAPQVTPDSPNAFSEDYQPPVFEPDDRVEKVNTIAADFQSLIEDYAEKTKIPGIAYGLVVDNQLVFSGATGLLNLETEQAAHPKAAFRIASMTKSFTAMAILKLRDEGKLSLEDPVAKYIPDMAKLNYLSRDASTIDLENLLTMTAGFPEDNPWGDRQLDESNQMLMDMVSEGISFSNVPSYAYEYSNTGYALLGNIVSRVSGMPYQQYITSTIFEPLGMNNTYWEVDEVPEDILVQGYRWEEEQWKEEPYLHDGAFGSMGGIITTIEDFSKYVSFHLSAWPPSNAPDDGPVKRSSLREMQTPQFPRLSANAKDPYGKPCAMMSGYGFGLGIRTDCHGVTRVSHGGALPGFGSNYSFYPEYGIGIMAFCNLTYTRPWPFEDIQKLLRDLKLEKRNLPVSDILQKRKEQVLQLIQSWDDPLGAQILAENFYLDQSKALRQKAMEATLEKAGAIKEVKTMKAFNQLRGVFDVLTEHGKLEVYFTLSPEADPKVQDLEVSFSEGE